MQKNSNAATIKFHKDIYLPENLRNEALSAVVRKNGRYKLTTHALERLQGIYFGWKDLRSNLPEKIPFFKAEVVEVTTDSDGRFLKGLLRFPSGDGVHDWVVSYTSEGRIATVYINTADDKHRTLNRSVYARAA